MLHYMERACEPQKPVLVEEAADEEETADVELALILDGPHQSCQVDPRTFDAKCLHWYQYHPS